MYKLISIFSFMLIYVSVAFGQAQITIPILANDGSVPFPLETAVGLDVTATDGLDLALGEAALPPLAPGLDVRFEFTGITSYFDFRPPGSPAVFPFTGLIQHVIVLQASAPGLDILLEYDIPVGATMFITDQIGGSFLDIGPFNGIGTAVIPADYLAVFGKAFLNMEYTDIAPAGPEPLFDISPASLDFGPVGIGVGGSMLQATVSNPGTDPLDVTGITSSDAQYTFSPATFTVAPGGNQLFDVTFDPAGLGTFPADITFTHNAPSSPDVLQVTGVGADAGPTFGVTPASLDFGVVPVGNTPIQTLTVINNGLSISMDITSVTAPAGYTVAPTAAVVAPGATVDFDVTFAPLTDITYAGDITFTHGGTSSPDVVTVTGAGFVPAAVSGLVFSVDTTFVPENTYDLTATMQLLDLLPGESVHALQFKLQTNMVVDDETILTYQSIEKSGSIASDPDWILETNVVRGTINPNGASEDLIYCLLYNIGTGGLTGDWTDLTNQRPPGLTQHL